MHQPIEPIVRFVVKQLEEQTILMENIAADVVRDWIGVIIMTNGDKIRSMSDMELSRELCKIAGVCSECLVQDMCDKGHTGFEQWLKEEVNEDE